MPVRDHKAFILPDEDTVIWRYVDLEKFESMLNDKSLFFCRSDKFSDPFEGTVPKIESEFRIKTYMEFNAIQDGEINKEEAVKFSNDVAKYHKKLRSAFVVNCWHINKGESDAMWRLYLKTNEGIAIQSTVERLKQALIDYKEDIWISKVRYLDYEKDIWFHQDEYPNTGYNFFSPIIHKRLAFAHESELRIFQQINEAVGNEKYWENKPNHIGKQIPIDIENLIEKIILPPTSDEFVKNKVKGLLKKNGLNRRIEQSKLNEEPHY